MRLRSISLAACAATTALGVAVFFGVPASGNDNIGSCLEPERIPVALPAPLPELATDQLDKLIRWIGAHTDYDISASLADPPTVSLCRTGETILYEGLGVVVDEGIRAAYDTKRRHIFLVAPWSANDAMDVSRLLHELVHDVQFLNRGWDCPQETEWDAYKLQEAWLAERGIDPGFDWLWIYFHARCPQDIHP